MHLRSFSSGGTTNFLTWTWTWTCQLHNSPASENQIHFIAPQTKEEAQLLLW